MTVLLPAIKDWVKDTEWVLERVFYYYNSNPVTAHVMGQQKPLLSEGHIEEGIEICLQAPGLHETGPKVPMVFPNPTGEGMVHVTKKRLEYEEERTDFSRGVHGIRTCHGLTSYKLTAVIVV